jgi:hypothetical protein
MPNKNEASDTATNTNEGQKLEIICQEHQLQRK